MVSRTFQNIWNVTLGRRLVDERSLIAIFGFVALLVCVVFITALASYRPTPVHRALPILPVTVEVPAPARLPAELPTPQLLQVAAPVVFPAIPADDQVEYPVQRGDTLIGVLQTYCRHDYLVVARENNIDPNWIYAGKTVLKFKNGCLGNAPSVLVKQSVSPRELVRNGEASSGKHISSLAKRDTEAQLLPSVAGSASAPSTSQSIRTSARAVIAIECDEETIAPKSMAFNERARALQICLMKKHQIGKYAALKKAKNQLVASLPKPDAVSCEATAKQGLFAWVACMREHYGETIRLAASQHRLDESLVLAVLHQESKGDPHAVSTSWCLSFMQILPSTAEAFGVDMQQIFDPHVNIDTGVKVLRRYLDIARGNLSQALASYNLGPGDVQDRMKSSEGFDPAAFAYTRNVLRVKQQIEKKSRRLATSAPALVPVVYTPAR
ncbi:MAG: transglycosylase SLT domain-containing protein [Candidatus Moraniibacteriota bacterium]